MSIEVHLGLRILQNDIIQLVLPNVGHTAAQRRRQNVVSVGKERREALFQTKRLCRVGVSSVSDQTIQKDVLKPEDSRESFKIFEDDDDQPVPMALETSVFKRSYGIIRVYCRVRPDKLNLQSVDNIEEGTITINTLESTHLEWIQQI